uniref:uncharacterized protein LOC122581716 isoform X2 n=1 Tax=Erigeron canadensis TaxID=72917 RepID=UPI001CB95975|nr:uncharacterized protein LOC122581716 isoform X2 [Erigeron canadensis]
MPHYVNFEAFNTVSKISVPEVKLQDIEVATNNFLMCIGEHEFGLMYKGELSILGKPTTSFLIKRFMDIDDNDGPLGNHVLKYFLDQVFELGGQPQSNVISMLGYCIEEKEKIIVYECPGRGRLDQYIRYDNSSSTTLTWLVRLKICAGAAHAVDHSHGIDFIYNDIESSKILVDDRWLAKVTDFLIYAPSSKGLDRGVDADHAYGAPEYINNGVPTDKTNVYSFGVVLFEVLCGRLCTEEVNGVMLSPKLIKDLYETMKLAEIVDPSLREEMISSSSLDKYSAIAYQCLLDDPQQRPSMADVAKELEELFRIEAFSTLSVPEVKLQEIKVATNNFDMCIGEHEFGKMYKGVLSILGIPTTVLLKRYMNMNIDERSENHLTDHDGTLCRQPHQNAISILGFCIGKREKITIYEYPGRGRLDQYIRRSNNSSTTPLTWLLRLKICVGAAHAIDHAHSIHVIYSDIKSSKILVDDNWEAKVTDFLISTPGSKGLDKGVVADHAYGAPELINNGVRTDKTNVYSFGMVLFEVLCGRLCTEEVDGVMLSPKLIIDLYETMKLAEIVDPSLRKEMISSSSLGKYSAIAYRCLLDDPQQRPSMADVAKEFVELIRMERIHQSTLQEVPLKEIQVATNYFQSYIGKHDCGDLIYEGELSITGIPTKVYILSFLEHSRRPMSYLETVGYLSELQNLTYIAALGYCYEEGEKIIVYEHPEGGSLDQYIRHSSNTTLTWIQRLNICFRAACGLFQVHQRHIFQRAFRSANILLDTEQVAKVCDFMISAPNTSTSLGDIAADRVYGAPEVILSTGKASKEADVYAFGVVLFEVLCGRLFTEEVDGVMLSAQLIKDLIETKKLAEVVDPSLRKEMISSSSLDKYSAIAYRCLLDDPQQRPSLADVAKEFVELIRMEAFSIISVPEVKLQEIELATNNFEMCIGEHKCGKMYKGELSIPGKPTTVLLKRYMNIDELSESHFLEQDGTLCRQPHQNTISVLGFCMEKGEKITVYEYPGRGSLDQYIRRNNNSSTTSLTWLLRLKICAGAAHAVHHAHSICVIYTDIESSKILVDDKWEAKVTDFLISTPGSKGLDRHVIADHAYGAPEFINNGVPTDKTNVYSFGVVLFEILCGRLCTEEVAGVMLSPKLIIDLYETMKLDEFVDPSLREEMISSSSLEKYSSIAYRCLLDDPQQRPSMADVAKELEELLDIESIHQGTLQEVSLKEIQVATNNFQLYIGKNPSGDLIYEGELSILGIPTKVYIIRFHEHSEHGFSYFKLLDMYSKLRHPNIFLTLGYCFEEGENIIVHRYPEGVSLDQYISRRRSDTTSLTWLQRLEICAGAGRGLSYTHSKGLCEPGFKSALIFLDDKWVAKIANSDISPQYSDKGADAYKSPEYNTDHGFETSESNVYTFGIVLFEVLCGRLCSEELDGYMLSAKLMKEFYEKKKLEEIVDPALLTEETICPDSLDTYSAIVYRCLHDDPQQRPSMDEVVLELEELLRIQLQL